MANEHFDLTDLRRRWLPAPVEKPPTHPKMRAVVARRDPLLEVPMHAHDLRVRVQNDLPKQWPLLAPFFDELEQAMLALAQGADEAARKDLAARAENAAWRIEELLEVYYFLAGDART